MSDERWPALPLEAWQATCDTLHMYSQIVGKIRLMLAPMMNQWWQVPFYLTARGLSTSPIPYRSRSFELEFDFFDHQLVVRTSEGAVKRIPLGMAVKDFYQEVMQTLRSLGIEVRIWTMPVEVADPVRFEKDDRHGTYDAVFAYKYWHVLRQVDAIFKEFRARFTGKCSPVHFFWGSFDLAVTRFSGRPAAPRPNADRVTRLAYNAELSSLGFWPGGDWFGTKVDAPVFYSYAYPQPAGFEHQRVQPDSAYYDAKLGEFILRYDDVRQAIDPRKAILDFAQSTYEAAARLQGWPIDELGLTTEEPARIAFYREPQRAPEASASPSSPPDAPHS